MANPFPTIDPTPLATAQARSTHTPGPWTDIQFGDRPQSVSAINGAISICSFNAALYKLHPDQARANARLIAAAPDLLEALEGAFNQLDESYGHGISNRYWPTIAPLHAQIRAAIKKARG